MLLCVLGANILPARLIAPLQHTELEGRIAELVEGSEEDVRILARCGGPPAPADAVAALCFAAVRQAQLIA